MSHGGHGSSEFRRNLYGWFGVACRLEIFEEIFIEMLLTQEMNHRIIGI